MSCLCQCLRLCLSAVDGIVRGPQHTPVLLNMLEHVCWQAYSIITAHHYTFIRWRSWFRLLTDIGGLISRDKIVQIVRLHVSCQMCASSQVLSRQTVLCAWVVTGECTLPTPSQGSCIPDACSATFKHQLCHGCRDVVRFMRDLCTRIDGFSGKSLMT